MKVPPLPLFDSCTGNFLSATEVVTAVSSSVFLKHRSLALRYSNTLQMNVVKKPK